MQNSTDEFQISRSELEAYIGGNAKGKFYSKVLNKYMINPNTPNWCWPSFFLGMFWFAYRKAIIPTLIIATATFTLNTLIPLNLALFLDILLFFILGLFGVNVFLFTAEKDILRIKQNNFNLNSEALNQVIAKKGGTSNLYAFVLYTSLAMLYFVLL